jgi:hypothetical protein
MFRVATVYMLMLTTVAGPLLCCCTAERVVIATQQLVRLAGLPGRARETHTCCGGQHGNHNTPRPRSPKHPGDPSLPPPRPCPCQAETPSVEFSIPPETSTTLIVGDFADGFCLPFPFLTVDLAVPRCAVEFTKSRGPFITAPSGGARALLSALHILLC